ncbi:GGDEF domain-containing protein [Qipengyuania qiaonensis]|uniref:diguanylate cyclase n=1 Tax=Qipengyuania qiaonensis TaxID=2867240 RepID=A0ABS7J5P1_9SPHN|nr:diguanylate cyclase [Qipengyuania qiaonensis]MBX7482601.1 GGDEF domain-containing protein [Qipengyuania qiaonensis]
MGRVFHHLLILLAVAGFAISAGATRAAEGAGKCILPSDKVLTAEEAASAPDWRCNTVKADARGKHSWVRIPAEAVSADDPVLIGDAMASDGLLLARTLADDSMMTRVIDPATLAQNWTTGTRFALPLSEFDGKGPLYVRVDRPLGPDVADSLRVVPAKAAALDRTGSLVLLGIVIGMLLLTAVVSGFMTLALRRRFAALHFAFSLLLAVYVATSGSLVFLVAPDLSLWARSVVSYAAVAWAIALLAPFALAFFEPEMLGPRMRRLTIACGLLAFAAGFFLPLGALFDVSLRTAYNLSFIPGAVVTLVATGLAWHRGSEAARVFALAWSVPFLFAIERLARNLGLYSLPPIADFGFYLALAFEAAALMAAVGWRVNMLRRERDAALAASTDLAREARYDALTELGNRRDYDAREWQDGEMLGLIDIDRFKSVNDTYGHATGDCVLEAIGDLLRREMADGTFVGAWRLGGEEFAVVLQTDHVERAALDLDRVRREIPYVIDAQVPGLDDPVTASVGLAQVDPADPATSYREADLLLYSAKRGGRDRLCFDRRTPAPEHPDAAPLLPLQLNRSRKVS